MDTPESKNAPERIARKIVADCADCDCCRPIMDEACLFFPELYRLYDRQVETGQPIAAAELRRVTRPGGIVAMANWTPEGFIGKMFNVFKAHLPPPPAGVPSPMGWGNETTVRLRLRHGFAVVGLNRRIALMRYPFPPAETVEFFRQYYGPTQRAFASLDASAQAALRRELVELQTANNIATAADTTEVAAEYLEIVAVRSV